MINDMIHSNIAIHYRARLTYRDDNGPRDRFCDVEHVIDPETLRTVKFDFTPLTINRELSEQWEQEEKLAERIRVEEAASIDRQRAEVAEVALAEHLEHVKAFLSEMRSIMIDPLEDGVVSVSKTCAELIAAAIKTREDGVALAELRAEVMAVLEPFAQLCASAESRRLTSSTHIRAAAELHAKLAGQQAEPGGTHD